MIFFVILATLLIRPIICEKNVELQLGIVRDSFRDIIECYFDKDATPCIEQRTAKQMHHVTNLIKKDVFAYFGETMRLGKTIKDDPTEYTVEENEEMARLMKENEQIADRIRAKDTKPTGFVDELSNLFTYGIAKLFGFFSPGKQTDEDLTEQIVTAAAERKSVVEGRGHKKKYLKKQNKHLKIILLIMLLKNKMKVFMHKFQLLLQLKFLGIAVLNLLINAVRLWLDLKKKKPHKVVYYENAHHQHHYDHEHVHDDYSHPGSHSHYSHHEEEYGGGPWPWSRSYIEKQSEQAFQSLNTHQQRPNLGAHNIVYLKQRPVR